MFLPFLECADLSQLFALKKLLAMIAASGRRKPKR
jgi:hypothetical protein